MCDELLFDLKIDPIKVAVDKGESITGSWSATGGVPPYTYDYEWVISSSDGYELIEKSDQNSVDEKDTIKPLWGETGTLQVLVKDRVGQTVLRKATFGITGAPVEPLDLQLTLEDSVSLGETIIGSCKISDGSAPYKYTYRWYIRIEGASEDILASINRDVPEAEDVFIPGFGDTGKLSVQVIDAAGRRGKAEASFDIEGNATEGPLQLHIFLNNDSTAIGEEIEGSWYAVGGTPPYRYAYYWYIYDEFIDESHHSGANMEVAVGESYSNVYRFVPSRGSKGEMLVSVWDSLDNQVYHKMFFDITEKVEPTPTTAPTETPTPTPTAEPTATPVPTLKGDANGDSAIDILDLVSIIDYIVSNTDPVSPANADANGDGSIDILDLVWIIDKIVGS